MSERGEPPASLSAALRDLPLLLACLLPPLRGRACRSAGDADAAAPAAGGLPSAAAAACAAARISAALLARAAISSPRSCMVASTASVRARVSRVSSSCCLCRSTGGTRSHQPSCLASTAGQGTSSLAKDS